MSRDGLSFLVNAALFMSLAPSAIAAPPEDRDSRMATMLGVQRALQEGRDQLQRGNFEAAVHALESQVARIDGNREYLNLLRDAYHGLIRELQQSKRFSELPVYQRRLEILDPGAVIDPGTSRPSEEKPSAPSLAQLAQQARDPGKKFDARGVPAEVTRDRGDQANPFRAGNVKEPSAAKGLLNQAELEFSSRHYDAAGRLFEQASRIDPDLVTDARERWAYCKVVGVADQLNRQAVSEQNSRDAEQAVRQAMSMSPKLDSFGKLLLKKIQERSVGNSGGPETAIEVRHLPGQAQGWAVAETTNFRILHRQPQEMAERVARSAEATRTAMSKKWFGDDGATWSPRCDLYLHATGQDYAKATGVPASSPGHSTIRSEGERILSRRIDLHCDNPNMSIGVLPHETTHVVLAGRFGDHAVPRWADEGMAVLSEPRERIDLHLRNLPKHSQERQLFGVGQLLRLNDYPDPRYIGPFYAQSVSLVDFLSQEKGPRVFAQFLRDGLQGSYEAALDKHYGIQGFHDLEARWQRFAFGDGNGAPVMVGRSQ